jgi:hypothetical protein
MKLRLAAVALLALGGVAVWLVARRDSEIAPPSTPTAVARSQSDAQSPKPPAVAAPEGNPEVPEEDSQATAAPPLPPAVAPKPKTASLAALEDPPHESELPEATGLPPLTALENMRSAFRQYTARFGGNPVGDNAEITAAMNGQNPRQVVFFDPDDGLRLNARGELVDNWGTPYFFHQLSRTQMEIRSAGPDKKMWTSDDLVLK